MCLIAVGMTFLLIESSDIVAQESRSTDACYCYVHYDSIGRDLHNYSRLAYGVSRQECVTTHVRKWREYLRERNKGMVNTVREIECVPGGPADRAADINAHRRAGYDIAIYQWPAP